ncbi:hypothetical protein P170DRAFT_480163 [Aspergillus steynii IBT 23096]|uniref:Zn(2)-C6 fungal-type domain-containing protein n=1 Tax=Aspergillus steynii IBT 23096 TaxID=1392250 RepID=A0A2I2FUS2_9EURO|nr:uncharacterized protein P170DRAFT_480163 [Aspergillus steynii IBT 23096]PLB44398.1 hypothetical protein P170DRAFT_480163 [Aspergillus steynii IBT 23096]
MASKGPSVSTPNKDCQKCKSRRIPCDRTLPKCRKCISRNFDCPGYGVHLRWDQGVASRGKLMGRCVPLEKDLPKQVEVPSPLTIQPSPIFNQLTSQLIRHFDQGVATKLAWIDGPGNLWRNFVLPLSHTSPTVLFSVLAMASEDLACKYPADHPWFSRLRGVSGHNRDKALSSLAQQLSLFQTVTNPSAWAHPARCALASMLLLYNTELLTAEDDRWPIHIQGARAIVQWKSQATQHAGSVDLSDVFLLYEYYFTSVFMNLTRFDPSDDISEDIPTHGSISFFSDFVRIIHAITRAERLRSAPSLKSELPRLEEVFDETVAAKDKIIHMGHTMEFKSSEARCDFEYLVYMYYHAILIYSQRVLSDNPSEEFIQLSRDAIFTHLSYLSRSAYFAHDLVWPVFIAGSECRGIPSMQETVEHAMLNIMQLSGRLDRHRVLSFLKTFWALDLEPGVTWIHLARAKPIDHRFLIF